MRKNNIGNVSYKQKRPKMKCEDVNNEILSLIEGDLDQDKARSLREHIASCKTCEPYSVFVSAVMDEIDLSRNAEVSSSFNNRFFDRLQVEKSRTAGRRMWLASLTAAAMIMIGIFTGLNLGRISAGNNNYADLPDEYYYANEIHLETIEGFFINQVSNEKD